jgi:hypothetical protein
MRIWPNLSKGIIHIQYNGTDNTKMLVFDLLGKIIATNTPHTGVNSINIESLPGGAYVMHIQSGNSEAYNSKIFKQ